MSGGGGAKALEAAIITAALEEGGAIARRLLAYEKRESQLDLMRLVIRAFNEDALAAAEAGTGVGKSFAYLLPALSYALANEERIVVSTATITLQEQLFEKDIPLVRSALGEGRKIKALLVKGRGNYLCLRRLGEELREGVLEDGEREELEAVAAWAGKSAGGSLSDLPFLPSGGLWSRLCSEADLCMGTRCPERERCFVQSLRREAAAARILVVNHHLLFADLAARRDGAGYEHTAVLPPYTRVIIDEAHNMEEAATSFFSRTLSRPGLYRQLGRLYRRRRGLASGLLVRLAALSGGGQEELDAPAEILGRIRDAADLLDRGGLEIAGGEGVFRLTPSREEPFRLALVPHLIALRKHIAALVALVTGMLEGLSPEAGDDSTAWETGAVLRRIEAAGAACGDFIGYKERPEEVMWLERHGGAGPDAREPWTVFTASPLEVAPALREALFEPNKTVVCLSATLTTADSFDYWQGRSGFGPRPPHEPGSGDETGRPAFAGGYKGSRGQLQETGGAREDAPDRQNPCRGEGERKRLTGRFPSPFPYGSSVLLAVPSDAPLPEEASYRAFVDEAVTRLVESAGGSALVLFTSHEALRSACDTAKPALESRGIRCLRQGDDDRHRLLKTFLEDRSSVLFATDSFWEGVDAPGDTLRLVILCRLPFRTPNDPVFEARCDAVKARGGSPFMELSLPEAVMKFRQGFGRLMRRSSDHGVVAVLDGRLLRKRYGEFFLRSLPETRTRFTAFDSLPDAVERFLFPPRGGG